MIVDVLYRAIDTDVILPMTHLYLMAVKVIEDPSTFLLAIYKLTLVEITIFYGDFRINIYEFSDKSISRLNERLIRELKVNAPNENKIKQAVKKKNVSFSILYVICH